MDERQLAQATTAAAQLLAAGGAAARSDGPTLSCTYAGGPRVIVCNSLQHSPAFSAELLLSKLSDGIVRALVDQL